MSSQNTTSPFTASSGEGHANEDKRASAPSVVPSKRPATEMPVTNARDYDYLFKSPQFIFRVGKDQTQYMIHSAVVEDISAPLTALMKNGEMEESRSGVAVLEDVEAEVFVAFCAFAYTGKYKTPSLGRGFDNEDDQKLARNYNDTETPDFIFAGASTLLSDIQKRAKRPNLLAEPVETVDSPDLVFHAKVYTFATKYLVEPLRQLCFSSLYRDLFASYAPPKPVGTVLDLLEYTFAHTPNVEPRTGLRLRRLVIYYVASHLHVLCEEERFKEILREHGAIGLHIIELIVSKKT